MWYFLSIFRFAQFYDEQLTLLKITFSTDKHYCSHGENFVCVTCTELVLYIVQTCNIFRFEVSVQTLVWLQWQSRPICFGLQKKLRPIDVCYSRWQSKFLTSMTRRSHQAYTSSKRKLSCLCLLTDTSDRICSYLRCDTVDSKRCLRSTWSLSYQ